MTMTAAQQASLAAASDIPIQTSARRMMGYGTYGRWLSSNNRYRNNALDVLESDLVSGTLEPRNLSDYIAASAPLHCCDGWALLGRALGCHLRGDSDVARHLAYYAELRAAMSLLATQGVGVFRWKHVCVDATGVPHQVHSKGTHTAAWDLLEQWAGLPVAADLLGRVLSPAGVSIADWLKALPSGASWQPIATQWLRRLGMDLEVFSTDDHDARNEASYRPNYIRPRSRLPSDSAVQAAVSMWRLLEPSPPLAFAELDRYLLRKSLETAFEAVRGKTVRQARGDFKRQVDAAVAAHIGGPEGDIWRRFLRREDQPEDPSVLGLAEAVPRPARPDYHVSMISRALLLLRVASGATRLLLSDAGVGLQSLSFWWSAYGVELGLWEEPAPEVSRLTDGWADTEAILDDIETYLADGNVSYHSIISDLPQSFAALGRLEMVGVWSLAA
jgi:hypothetical protein